MLRGRLTASQDTSEPGHQELKALGVKKRRRSNKKEPCQSHLSAEVDTQTCIRQFEAVSSARWRLCGCPAVPTKTASRPPTYEQTYSNWSSSQSGNYSQHDIDMLHPLFVPHIQHYNSTYHTSETPMSWRSGFSNLSDITTEEGYYRYNRSQIFEFLVLLELQDNFGAGAFFRHYGGIRLQGAPRNLRDCLRKFRCWREAEKST